MKLKDKMFFYKNRKLFSIIIIILILITLNRFFLREVKNMFYTVTLPIQNVFWEEGEKFSGFFETLFEFRNLEIENRELLKQNQKLSSAIGEINELRKENKTLREALSLGIHKEFELVLTEVISKETEGDFILILKGENEGILEGMPVITKEKIVVGIIDKVYKNFSRASLISNPKNSFDVKIQNERNGEIYGLAQGKGNLKIQLKFIPQEKELTKGNVVFTAALAGVFPKGLLVGKIGEVKKNDVSTFQEAEIKPFFKEDLSGNLFIIKNFVSQKEGE